MSKVFVVIDLGCHECGVESEPVGIYATEKEAVAAANKRDKKTKGWRDGGQTYCGVFEMPAPKPNPTLSNLEGKS